MMKIRYRLMAMLGGAMALFALGAEAATCNSSRTNGNWNSSKSWTTCRTIPAAGDAVFILNGHAITVNTDTATIGNLTINAGGRLLFSTASNRLLSVAGNFTNNGTFTAGTGSVELVGNTVQTITGNVSFNNLTVNNPAGIALAANAAVTIAGTATIPANTNMSIPAGSSWGGYTCATAYNGTYGGLAAACGGGSGSGALISSPSSCSSQTGVGTLAWAQPANATASDNRYAMASAARAARAGTTNYLNCTGFNFSTIPAGATITGISVLVERSASRSGRARDNLVYLIKGGTISTAFNGATATTYPTTDAVEAHGGANSLWGTTWTPADVTAANFGVAFSSSARGKVNFNVDHIRAQVYYQVAAIDHVSINAPATATISTTVPVVIVPHTTTHGTVAAGSSIRLSTSTGTGNWTIGSGTGTLTPGAANSGQATYTFGAGETSATLGFTALSVGTVTLNVADANGNDLLVRTPAAEKANTISFGVASYMFTSSACSDGVAFGTAGQCVPVTWSPRIAGTALGSVYVTALNASGVPTRLSGTQSQTRSMQFGLSCHDPVANAGVRATFTAAAAALPLCQSSGARPASWTTAATLTFPAGSPSSGPYSFNYHDVGKVELWGYNTSNGQFFSSGPFVVRPASFTLSGIKRTSDGLANPAAADAAGAKFAKAGEAFSITVAAVSSTGAVTPNYGQEVVPESVKLAPALVAGLGLTQNPALAGSFGAFSAGEATGTAFSWGEVGIITLTPSVNDGNYLGAGNVTGAPSGNVGRFYPDHFAVTPMEFDNRADWCDGGFLAADGTTPCVSPAYTYMGELFNANFILEAKNAGNALTQNYSGAFAKLDPLAANNTLNYGAVDFLSAAGLTGRLDTSLVSANGTGLFVNGSADVTVPLAISRGAAPDGPYTDMQVGILPLDSDGVTAAPDLDTNGDGVPDRVLVGSGTTEVRYGRIRLSNAHGSEFLPLPVVATVQYYNGAQWVVSADDNETWFDTNLAAAGGDLGATIVTGLAGGVSVASPGVAAVAGGMRTFRLNPPGSAGSVSLVLGAPAYLPGNVARATFGVYKGGNEFIYLRENY